MTVDALTDVAGVRVGHATRTGDGRLTGTTVVLAPEGGAVAAVAAVRAARIVPGDVVLHGVAACIAE